VYYGTASGQRKGMDVPYDGHDDSSIVRAIIRMGESLKHLVVAEGSETRERRVYLQTQSCAEGQGFLFSRPLAAAKFAHWLQMGLAETVVH
jgi:EAL domain-containing protein (putative c-di-GMP-specific phosphodiesterase class I)